MEYNFVLYVSPYRQLGPSDQCGLPLQTQGSRSAHYPPTNYHFTTFWPTLPTYESPNRGTLGYLMSLGTLRKITTRSAKFSWKNSRICISKDEKSLYSFVFGKLRIMINHGSLRPILPTKHSFLRSRCFVCKIGLGNTWFSKISLNSL